MKPDAAFYIFPKMDIKKFNISDDEQVRTRFSKCEKDTCNAWRRFPLEYSGSFQGCISAGKSVLEKACYGMREFFAEYKQCH